MQKQEGAPRLRLRVTTAAETAVRAGHPWVFAESISEQNRDGKTGELAVIYDKRNKFLAAGLFDAESPIRVRVLHAGKPQTIDAGWWRARLASALERRRGLFDSKTTGWRCINGESDGWPGLVLDRYDTTLVLKLYTAAWLPRLAEVKDTVAAALPHERMVLRLSRNVQKTAREKFRLDDGAILRGETPAGPVIFRESGLKFEADVLRGQKTGFFLDQRENRRFIETLAHGRTVVNAFSFTGGFSVYAARGGAKSVTDVDISAHALEGAKRNFKLNSEATGKCRHESVQADVFEWLRDQKENRFDLAILDPPSLAKKEKERAGAIQAYGRLAAAGIRLLRPRGILAAASCSAHVSADEFFAAVRSAALKSRRQFAELRTSGHTLDHPATFKEAAYLKAIFIELS
jgi:23S rRNA (cytosine1962-C5)-methyltransferase